MKRSEAIQILNAYIVDRSGDCDGEEILTIIEAIGMLPPTTWSFYDDADKTTKLEYIDGEYYPHWESED